MSEQQVLFSDDRPSAVNGVLSRPRDRSLLLTLPRADPGSGAGRVQGLARRTASVLIAAGLVSVSWDRLLNVPMGAYNVKLPSLLFTLAFVCAIVASRHPERILLWRGPGRTVLIIAVVIVVYEAVRGAFSALPLAALAQVVAVLTGAVLPAVSMLLVVRSRRDLRWGLSWFLVGAALAAAFGLYQLLAFYLRWPQGVSYTGVGIGTGFGRISAFNYEPAYFSYYLVLALGSYVAWRRLDGADVGWRALVAFALVLYLANVRAAPLLVAAFGILLVLAFRWNRGLLFRGAVVLFATAVLAVAVPYAVSAVGDMTTKPRAAATATAPALQPSDRSTTRPGATRSPRPNSTRSSTTATPRPTIASPTVGSSPVASPPVQNPLQSVDPAEPSSNAPRLALYTAVLREVAASPLFGLGAGNLGAALQRSAPGAITDQQGGQVVANNIWLQALVDGGIPQLLLEAALVGSVIVAAMRRRWTAVYPMAAAWIAVVLVGGMLTSYLFDIKVWVVLALVLVGFSVEPSPGRHAAHAGDPG